MTASTVRNIVKQFVSIYTIFLTSKVHHSIGSTSECQALVTFALWYLRSLK